MNPGKRTILLDAQGNPTESGKQKKARRDDGMLTKCRRAIYHLHEAFALLFEIPEAQQVCIDTMMSVTGHVWSVYNAVKQDTNRAGGLITKMGGASGKLKLGTKEVTLNDAMKIFKKICLLYGVKFSTEDEDKKVRGCLQSQIALIYAFKYKMQENLYLNDKFTISDGKDERKAIEVGQYGIQPRHYCLLGGANMTPTLQTALRQGLGPATILINLARCTNDAYKEKWKKAAAECFAGVVGITDVIGLICSSGREYADLIEHLCNLATTGICCN